MDCSARIVRLQTRLEHLKKIHNEWKALCQHTIESGFPVADTRTAEDLSRRLELVARDVEVAIEITQYGISREKDRQKSHDIYGTIDQSLELRRRLEQVEEELELRDAVTEATNRRREEEARSLSDKAHESVEPSQQLPSEKKANQSNEDRHRARLQENKDWLVNKIIAPRVATQMYQQGALTQRELETISSCSDLPTQAAEKLVKIVEDQPYAVFRSFKDALKKTQQDDVYMTLADMDFKAKTEHCETIRQHYNLLLEEMDLKHSGALDKLFGLHVIDLHDIDAIKSERTHIGMNEMLLALLSRKSFESFQKFLQTLNETGQSHLVYSINEHPETSLSHVISSDRQGMIAGVTVYNEKLFVLREESEERLEQFDVEQFNKLESIAVEGLSDDGWWGYKSLTSCNINSCLYVNDWDKVFRVDLSTKDVISWPVDGGPIGLAVSISSNVLVTCYEDHTVKEYSSRGSFVRSIKLQVNHVMEPFHCVQLTDSRYVVSHRLPVEGVSEIDEHGTLIATYRNSETTEMKMSCPQCIVIVNNSIFVSDFFNNRILLLDTSLSDARPLSLPVNSQLYRPRCMYLEQSRGRLFVGEASGRVLVINNCHGLMITRNSDCT